MAELLLEATPMPDAATTPTETPVYPGPPSSALSDAPQTDPAEPDSQTATTNLTGKESTPYEAPQFSVQTEELVKRINANAATAAAAGTPGWEAAKEQIMRDMATSDKIPTPETSREASVPNRGGRGRKRASLAATEGAEGEGAAVKMEGSASAATPSSTIRGRGRGRPPGRARGGGRGGKRKRGERDEDGDSDSSEIYTPAATTTKSGRSVQKPTAFVPPAQASPIGTNKRKRSYRRNPESAVCKVCLRGTSPASNMIVFCDGCNTPYHRFCHQPPIDQSVIDEVDKEWFCMPCVKERVVPAPEANVADFVAAGDATVEQRTQYFTSLSQGILVSLLTKATSLHPGLPVFAPDFSAKTTSNAAPAAQKTPPQPPTNGHAHPLPPPPASQLKAATPVAAPTSPQAVAGAVANAPPITPGASLIDKAADEEEDGYNDHPLTYPRPGQGLMKTLPPEQEDLQWLVEDDDRFGVFSHMYQVDTSTANGGLHGSSG